MRAKIHMLTHPLAECYLTDIRDERSTRTIVRQRIRTLAALLFYEATRDLPKKKTHIRSPLARTTGHKTEGSVGLVPILRAGLGMLDGILELLPEARVFHLGLFRDEETLEAVEYYNKLSHHKPVNIAFILDPMLATGGSACAASARLKSWGVKRIKFLGLIAASEGVKALSTEHPDVEIFVCAVDSHLNHRGYIVPGMGDAGDRQFCGD